MTQKAPERIFAEFGYDMQRGSFWGHPSDQSIEYLHIDHALDLVAAERDACAETIDDQADRWRGKPDHMTLAPVYEAVSRKNAQEIRARTPADAQAALERRELRIRNEALAQAWTIADQNGDVETASALQRLITENQSDE